MALHIYQAQLLHYLTEDDLNQRIERAHTGKPNSTASNYSNPATIDKSITLLPVIAGLNVYPEYIANGALVVDDVTGCIIDYGSSETILTNYAETNDQVTIKIYDYRDKLIMPGFIDTHVHYPQIDMIAAYGEQLLDWLNNYTFVTEANFADPKVAHDTAPFF